MTQHVGADWRWLIKVCWISRGHTQVGSSLATWRQHRDRYNSDLYGTLQCCLFTPAHGCDVWVATNPWKQDKLALSQSTLICSDDQGGSTCPSLSYIPRWLPNLSAMYLSWLLRKVPQWGSSENEVPVPPGKSSVPLLSCSGWRSKMLNCMGITKRITTNAAAINPCSL